MLEYVYRLHIPRLLTRDCISLFFLAHSKSPIDNKVDSGLAEFLFVNIPLEGETHQQGRGNVINRIKLQTQACTHQRVLTADFAIVKESEEAESTQQRNRVFQRPIKAVITVKELCPIAADAVITTKRESISGGKIPGQRHGYRVTAHAAEFS